MQDFFDYLEYSISRTLANSADEDKHCYWCDGIMLPEIGDNYGLQRSDRVHKGNRQAWIAARAWLIENKKGGPAQHSIYEMNVFLGQQALAAYEAGEDMRSCVPAEDKDDWIGLDIHRGTIAVALL